MIRTSPLILIVVLVTTPILSGSDWPAFRGPNANGISPETGLNCDWKTRPPRVLWTVPLNAPSYAGPSVATGRLFILDHEEDREVVRALDLAKGEELWRYAYPDTASELYGYARSTAVIDDGRVYTLSRLGLVHCLDAEMGRCLWSLDLVKMFGGERPRWDYSMSPLVDGEKLILCPGGKESLLTVEKATGKTIWQGGGSATPVYATPVAAVIRGQRQYVWLADGIVMGVAAADGKRLWSYPYQTRSRMSVATPLVIGDGVLLTGVDDLGDAFLDVNEVGAKDNWKGRELMPRFSTPILYEGYVYGTSGKGYLVCLDPGTGKAMWKQPGFEWGGVVAYEGHLVAVNGQQGDVVLIRMDPSGYEERGRIHPLAGQAWTAPILADGKLIVRNKMNVACVDLR